VRLRPAFALPKTQCWLKNQDKKKITKPLLYQLSYGGMLAMGVAVLRAFELRMTR